MFYRRFEVDQVSVRDSAGLCVSVMTGSCVAHLTVTRSEQGCPLLQICQQYVKFEAVVTATLRLVNGADVADVHVK